MFSQDKQSLKPYIRILVQLKETEYCQKLLLFDLKVNTGKEMDDNIMQFLWSSQKCFKTCFYSLLLFSKREVINMIWMNIMEYLWAEVYNASYHVGFSVMLVM